MRALSTAVLLLSACTTTFDPDSTRKAVKTPLDAPTLSIVSSTQTSIDVQVCAGASGAAAGFSVHWELATDYFANGWSETLPSYCAASFSGVPGGSNFNLAPGECTVVTIGNLDDSEIGVSFQDGCNAGLACGTEYAFRAFAHAVPQSDWLRSPFSATIFGTTAACDDGCTFTQGYWKNHASAWPVASLSLGSVSYTKAQLIAILETPVRGNGLISLAHQLIAAKLNIANGANPSAISATIAAADAMIGALVVGSGYLAPATTSALTTALDNWNNGLTGPGHCE